MRSECPRSWQCGRPTRTCHLQRTVSAMAWERTSRCDQARGESRNEKISRQPKDDVDGVVTDLPEQRIVKLVPLHVFNDPSMSRVDCLGF